MAVFVTFWGTRGSIPTPGPGTEKVGGNTACVEIRFADLLCICDGGTGLRSLGLDLMRRVVGKPMEGHVFFSHGHWDHIQGFPFFPPAYIATNRFHVYGSFHGHRAYDLLSGQMHVDYFPVKFSDLCA